jgi:hypothetical protein
MLANHAPTTFLIRGNSVSVERGQLAYSIRTLSKRWRWNKRTTEKFFSWLQSSQMIHYRKSNLTTIITLTNYERYQTSAPQNAPQSAPQKRQSVHTFKNDIKKKERETDPTVEAFLSLWCEEYVRAFRERYVVNYGRDGAIVKDLLAVHPLEVLTAKMKAFFLSHDEWLTEHGYTIPIFKSRSNSLHAVATQPEPNATAKILLERSKSGQLTN